MSYRTMQPSWTIDMPRIKQIVVTRRIMRIRAIATRTTAIPDRKTVVAVIKVVVVVTVAETVVAVTAVAVKVVAETVVAETVKIVPDLATLVMNAGRL